MYHKSNVRVTLIMMVGSAIAAVVMALAVGCSDDSSTSPLPSDWPGVDIVVGLDQNPSSCLDDPVKVFADGSLVDVLYKGDTDTVTVPSGSTVSAKWYSTCCHCTEGIDTTATDGLALLIDGR